MYVLKNIRINFPDSGKWKNRAIFSEFFNTPVFMQLVFIVKHI